MPRRPRFSLVTAAVALVLLVPGCTTLIPGLPAPSSAAPVTPAPSAAAPTGADGVAWMEKVCVALLPAMQSLSDQPSLDSADPATVVRGLSGYLRKASTAVDGAITGIKAAGPSPIRGGDQAVTSLTTTLTSFRDKAQETRTKIDAIDTTDVQAMATELPQAIAPLASLTEGPNPGNALRSNPELDAAVDQAPTCQKIDKQFN